MPTNLVLPISISLSLLSWSLITYWYIHPRLQQHGPQKVLQPILLLHSFRYVGLMFLLPGVTSGVLDARFANPAAYGDLIAALLALLALGSIRMRISWAPGLVWVFNIWGMADLLNAVMRGLIYVPEEQFGAAFWIPATLVPPLLVTHVYVFIVLLKNRHWHKSMTAGQVA
jgi:hypothetical protein